jgi:nucleoside-diphosphate-sugar epimerase
MARVLVAGGAGFVGSHTVEALPAVGNEVTCVDNMRTSCEENQGSLAAMVVNK